MASQQTKLTRLRLEGTGPDKDLLCLELIEWASIIRRENGEGSWEDDGPHVQTAQDGYWARYTVTRKKDEGLGKE